MLSVAIVRGGPSASVAVTALLGAIAVAVAGTRLARTGGDVFDPLTLFALIFLLYFSLHALWLLAEPHRLDATILRPFLDEMARSQATMAGAFICLLIGYAVANRHKRSRRLEQGVSGIPLSVLAAAFVVGMFFNILALRAGGYSKATVDAFKVEGNIRLLRTFGFLSFAAFASTAIRATSRDVMAGRSASVLAWGVMLPVQVLWAFVTGTKSEALFAGFAALAIYNYQVRLVSLRTVGVALASFVLVLTPLIQSARSETANGNLSTTRELLRAAAKLPQRTTDLMSGHGLAEGFEIIQRRTNGSESVALAEKYTPSLRPYQLGRSWIEVPLSFVPRFLWRDKPYDPVTRDFSIIYGGEVPSRGFGLTLAPTIPGDLFMNFGLVGMVCGFFALGIGLKLITQETGPRTSARERSLLWYAVLIIPLLSIESEVKQLLSTLLLRSVVVFVFLTVALRLGAKWSGSVMRPTRRAHE
jgi:hypothetical protein